MQELLKKQSKNVAPKTLTDKQMQELLQQQSQPSRSERMTADAEKRAVDAEAEKTTTQSSQENTSLLDKVKAIGSKYVIPGTLGLGQSIGDALLPLSQDYKNLEKSRKGLSQQQQAVLDTIRAKLARGEDPSRLINALKKTQNIQKSTSDFNVIPSINKTAKQIYGEAGSTAVEMLAFGRIPKAASFLANAKGPVSGFLRGAGMGAFEGGVFGAAASGSRSLQEGDEDRMTILKKSLLGLGIGAAGGFVLGGLGGAIGGKFGHSIRSREAANQAFKNVDSGDIPGSAAAGFKKNAGVLIKDRVAQRAIQSGIPDDYVQLIKSVNNDTKAGMRKSFRIAEFTSGHKFDTRRASDVAGEEAANRIKFLVNKRKAVGKKIGSLIEKAPEKPIDVTDVYIDFLNSFKKYGITTKLSDLNETVIDFSKSRFKDNRKAQGIIQTMFKDLHPNNNGEVMMNAQKIYRLRQAWFDTLKIAKKKDQLIAGDPTEGMVDDVRTSLGDLLDNNVNGYKKSATQYAEISGVIKHQNDILGKGFDVNSDFLNQRAAEVYNRILGNASARPMGALQELSDTAWQYGYKNKSDIRHLVAFSDFMEDTFPSTVPTRSLQGNVARANRATHHTIGVAGDIARGDSLTLGMRVINSLGKDEQAVQELQIQYIKRLLDLK